jgi:hypothetical protein
VVPFSICEAEYIAVASVACQGVWLARLLGDLKNKAVESVELKFNNQYAMALMKNSIFHDRSKHVRMMYHFIEGVELKVNNQSVMALMKNSIFHDRSKHIRMMYHFIRRSMEDGDVNSDYVSAVKINSQTS